MTRTEDCTRLDKDEMDCLQRGEPEAVTDNTCSDDIRARTLQQKACRVDEVGSLIDTGDQLVEAIGHLFCCPKCTAEASQRYWAKKIGTPNGRICDNDNLQRRHPQVFGGCILRRLAPGRDAGKA